MEYVHGDIKILDKNFKVKKIIPIAEAMEQSFKRNKKYNPFKKPKKEDK